MYTQVSASFALAVLVPVLGANPSISFLCIHETDLVSFEIELT